MTQYAKAKHLRWRAPNMDPASDVSLTPYRVVSINNGLDARILGDDLAQREAAATAYLKRRRPLQGRVVRFLKGSKP